MQSISQVVDTALKKMREDIFPMMFFEEEIPIEMVDTSIESDGEYIGWKAIPSTITDSAINELEERIRFKLPDSYKGFLKYKHFAELHLEDTAIQLAKNLPKSCLEKLIEMNFETLETEYIIEQGYFYFADFQDYGLLAFNFNKPKENNEYEIVFIHHEDLENKHFYANNFDELLNFDGDESNRFIVKQNEKNKS
jgi:SMI1-KNR4 cell-wall